MSNIVEEIIKLEDKYKLHDLVLKYTELLNQKDCYYKTIINSKNNKIKDLENEIITLKACNERLLNLLHKRRCGIFYILFCKIKSKVMKRM